jgi:LmbE family N-acetylglucosaminyl deacetylase
LTPNGRTLLAVLAHPDDESFGTGGTLALYASRGVDVHLLCATRGEVGTVAPELLAGHASIADLRQNELECAADHLGLAGVHFLGYRDSGMAGSADNHHPQALTAQPIDEVAAKIASWIRRLRPQVVITFDPIGGYHHPDHIACHIATRLAFEAAGDAARFPDGLQPHQPEKLYFITFHRPWLRQGIRVLKLFGRDPRRWGHNCDIDLVRIMNEFPVRRIDIVNGRAQGRASACRQPANAATGLIALAVRLSDAERSTCGLPEPPRPTRDLFAGVVGWPAAERLSPLPLAPGLTAATPPPGAGAATGSLFSFAASSRPTTSRWRGSS